MSIPHEIQPSHRGALNSEFARRLAGGRMKLPDLANDEFIPLPPKIGAAPKPLS